jgi:hypothetical protein
VPPTCCDAAAAPHVLRCCGGPELALFSAGGELRCDPSQASKIGTLFRVSVRRSKAAMPSARPAVPRDNLSLGPPGSGALDGSFIRVAPVSEPSPGALAVDPIPGFGFSLKAGDLLGMAARPNRPYVPFVPNSKGLGNDLDLIVRFRHAQQGRPRGPRLGSWSGVLNPTGACRPVRPSGRGILCPAPMAEEWPLAAKFQIVGTLSCGRGIKPRIGTAPKLIVFHFEQYPCLLPRRSKIRGILTVLFFGSCLEWATRIIRVRTGRDCDSRRP